MILKMAWIQHGECVYSDETISSGMCVCASSYITLSLGDWSYIIRTLSVQQQQLQNRNRKKERLRTVKEARRRRRQRRWRWQQTKKIELVRLLSILQFMYTKKLAMATPKLSPIICTNVMCRMRVCVCVSSLLSEKDHYKYKIKSSIYIVEHRAAVVTVRLRALVCVQLIAQRTNTADCMEISNYYRTDMIDFLMMLCALYILFFFLRRVLIEPVVIRNKCGKAIFFSVFFVLFAVEFEIFHPYRSRGHTIWIRLE